MHLSLNAFLQELQKASETGKTCIGFFSGYGNGANQGNGSVGHMREQVQKWVTEDMFVTPSVHNEVQDICLCIQDPLNGSYQHLST